MKNSYLKLKEKSNIKKDLQDFLNKNAMKVLNDLISKNKKSNFDLTTLK